MKPDPKLCYHKAKALFFVRLSGRTFYLGSDRAAADRQRLMLLLDWRASGGVFAERPPQQQITLSEIFARWLIYAKEYYQGAPEHLKNVAPVIREFLDVYGSMPAAEFGPRALKAFRAGLCDGTLSRNTANRKVSLVRRVFTWAASEELIPASVAHALGTVEGLRAGRAFGVRETKPVEAVAWDHVEATLPYLPKPVAELMRLAWHTGARIGELLPMRAEDLNTTGAIWVYRLGRHKTAYKGRSRSLYFGAEAQRVLRPAMLRTPAGRALFSPLDSIAERSEKADVHRRPNQKPTPRKTRREVGETYDPHGICRAVTRAIAESNADPKRAELPKIPHWHPHQLRHSFAGRVRAEIGLEAAAAALGHADVDTTKIYAAMESGLAEEVARRLG